MGISAPRHGYQNSAMALSQPASRKLGHSTFPTVRPEILETFESMAVKSKSKSPQSNTTQPMSSPVSDSGATMSQNSEIAHSTETGDMEVAEQDSGSVSEGSRRLASLKWASPTVEARKAAMGASKPSQGLGSSLWVTAPSTSEDLKSKNTITATSTPLSSSHAQKSPTRSSAVSADLLTAMASMAVTPSPQLSNNSTTPVFSSNTAASDSPSEPSMCKAPSNEVYSSWTQGNPFTQRPLTSLATSSTQNTESNPWAALSPFTPKSTKLSPAPSRGLGASKWATSPPKPAGHGQPSAPGMSSSNRASPEPAPTYPKSLFGSRSARTPYSPRQRPFSPPKPAPRRIECPGMPKSYTSSNASPLSTNPERPDTSDLVARRLIGRDLGIKIPKKTDEKTNVVDRSMGMKGKEDRMANYHKWRNGNGKSGSAREDEMSEETKTDP